jgi:8-oxo-dGTP diphosphatase
MKNRIRATALVIKDGKVLLIHRKNEKEFYVFPGGGVEGGETVEQAIQRELLEETSIIVKINKILEHKIYNDGIENYAYLCDYVSGEPRLADDSPERIEMESGIEYYNPMWVEIKDLENMTVWPEEAKRQLIITAGEI